MDGARVEDVTMLLFVLNVFIVGFKNFTAALRVLGSCSLDVQSSEWWSCTGDSAPSEARKWGSGGGSPRKHDDFTNRSFGPDRSVKAVMELYQ